MTKRKKENKFLLLFVQHTKDVNYSCEAENNQPTKCSHLKLKEFQSDSDISE